MTSLRDRPNGRVLAVAPSEARPRSHFRLRGSVLSGAWLGVVPGIPPTPRFLPSLEHSRDSGFHRSTFHQITFGVAPGRSFGPPLSGEFRSGKRGGQSGARNPRFREGSPTWIRYA